MEETRITVHGNVVAEPIEREGRNASIFTTFRIATTPYKRTAEGRFVDGETSFYNVIAFGPLAANVASALRKGQPVIVEGTLTIRQWAADGKSGTSAEIDARHIGHDLSRGRAAFERVSRAAALGYERTSDPAVRKAIGALDDQGEGPDRRPDNVDADGVVHDGPAEDSGQDAPGRNSGLGDPQTDEYEAVRRSA